MSVIDRCN